MQQILSVLVSVVGGLAVSFLIYLGLNWVVGRTTGRTHARLLPYVFLGPVLVLLVAFLLVPVAQTVWTSLQVTDQYGLESFGGLANYTSLFTTPSFVDTLINNLLWILVVPALVVVIGLLVATLADRLGAKREKAFKTIIFLPMSVSFIAAASMWTFIYAYNAPGQPQVGLLNGIWTAVSGAGPVPWLQEDGFRLNSFLLMAVVVWLNAGYAMVLLSAAIKAVPEETVEAARIDGATERQAFFSVIAPQIRTTIVAVGITVLITVMKIFDIVFAMTNGQFTTNVLGVEFYTQFFSFNDPGKASAVVVILILAVVPVIVYQVRTYREQEALR